MNLREHVYFGRPDREYKRNRNVQERVEKCLNANPEISAREIETQMSVSKSEVSRILRKNKYHHYRMHTVQELRPTDYPKRRMFCNWYLQKLREDENFHNKILWTDESYFGSDGCFNSNNVHYWAQENPYVQVPRIN